MYNEPSVSSPHATLRGKPIEGVGATIANFKEAYIYEINGKPVSNMWKSYGAKRKIPAGKTSVILGAHLDGPLTAISEVNFYAKPGVDYQACRKESGMDVTLYVEEGGSGVIAGSSQTKKIKKAASAAPIFIPIVY